jgi:hypothetical protein
VAKINPVTSSTSRHGTIEIESFGRTQHDFSFPEDEDFFFKYMELITCYHEYWLV